MELCSMLCGSLDGRGVWGRMDTCICVAESLHCSPETVTTLLISYTPIQNKKLKNHCFSDDKTQCPHNQVPSTWNAKVWVSKCMTAHAPVRLVGLADWESGEVKLCLLPTSSEGEVGNDDIGGVCARRVGSTVVVG